MNSQPPTPDSQRPSAVQLHRLIAQGNALIEARKNPASAGKKLADFGEDYGRWNLAGKDLIARLSGPSAAKAWNYGWCRAMHTLDQDPAYCLSEHERQQAMLLELRAKLIADARELAANASALPTADERGPTNEELLADLRRVAKEMGKKTVTSPDYRRMARFPPGTLLARFETWNKTLAAAGLEVSKRYAIPAEKLFENLARVAQAVGRPPRQKDMIKSLSEYSASPYHYRFGGWEAALKAFAAWAKHGTLPRNAPAQAKTPRAPSDRLRYQVLLHDSFKCTACGRSPATHPGIHLHLDHILPRIRGGETTYENLTTLCQKCNLGKGTLVDDRLLPHAKKCPARRPHRRNPGPKRKGETT